MARTNFQRQDGRRFDAIRPVRITPDFVRTAAGSCLIEMGETRVICTASIEQDVPPWRAETGEGWVTAEYGMLPASTGGRKKRPLLKPDSRGVEIQRLIGRVLRGVVRLDRLGEHTITLDCDVLQADGGTRTASITGAYVALARAVRVGQAEGRFARGVLREPVAAVSVGIVNGTPLLDLCYVEDSSADVDLNVAMTRSGKFVELQGTSEGEPFAEEQLHEMIRLAKKGVRALFRAQQDAIRKGVKT
ncbi:MAG: ribonuclease PH [Phycisphaerae bacterium]|nr:ribonuclease PH [Phycisphaerae bacterium]